MNNLLETIETRLKVIEKLLKSAQEKLNSKTHKKANESSTLKARKQYKLVHYLAGILFKEAIQAICNAIEINDSILLETPFHQIVILFVYVSHVLRIINLH